MTDPIRMAKIAAAQEQFPEAVSDVKSNERFQYMKNKTSQAVNSRANVVIIKDKDNKVKDDKGVDVTAKYVIAVNISTNDAGSEQNLEILQDLVSEFLNNIHKNLN